MKTTLIVIQSDADHAQAKALVEKLMRSDDPGEQARMTAQARLIEAYERSRWPRRPASLPELLDQRLSLGVIRVALNHNQRRLHHTVSAFTWSYSACETEKPDHQNAFAILNDRDQSIVVRLDIEHQSAAFEDADLWMRLLGVFGRLPVGGRDDREPCVILRPCGLDALVTGPCRKVTLNDIGADNDHRQDYTAVFPKME